MLIYKYFKKFSATLHSRLTNSKDKATTIPENRTLYGFILRICKTIPVAFEFFKNIYISTFYKITFDCEL